ncbi:MAG: DUF86 domain-containing protein [Thermodesulfovibrio sp.]|uniref:type VII toxin-antitoxin system HepT family RNase toxin n=1 Tax=unclassified Thermodesulfovibrio TaxID=2645936 RepID=UPI0020B15D87|nr:MULTISPECIES: DUF86 domain-containing protein [unclassified Thermodesulfovibrio]MDI1472636.1 DUF86 domain-containing protein [Thermodesulfovibrio sp. 1176]MDI6714829.1 DUF86 domain-containing protein [Thermodesulfovibrio sp.]
MNIKRIADLIGFIEECLNELRTFHGISQEEFFSDKRNPAYVESYLRRALEAVFDIGRHILTKTYGFKELEYKKIAKELGNRGVVTEELSDKLFMMAGYRNRMVHFYSEITPLELFQIFNNNLGDIEEFLRQIRKFIDAYIKEK